MHMHFYCYVIGGNAYLLDWGKEWCHSDIIGSLAMNESTQLLMVVKQLLRILKRLRVVALRVNQEIHVCLQE